MSITPIHSDALANEFGGCVRGFRVGFERSERGWEASVPDAPTVHATGSTVDQVINILHTALAGQPAPNPYLALADSFADDPFADEVEAFIEAERQRERDAAAAEADA